METLDDLKQAWQRLELRVEHLEQRALGRARAEGIGRSRAALRWTSAGDAVQLAVWIAVVAIVAPFWIRHRATPHLLIAGLSLHVYAIAAILSGVLQLLLTGRAYHTGPVVAMQRRMAELRRLRIRISLALGLAWWVLWVPATLVAAMLLGGVDLYAASPAWVWASLAVGAAGIAGSLWLAHVLAGRTITSPTLRRMIDDLAGRSFARAAREAEELDRFEQA